METSNISSYASTQTKSSASAVGNKAVSKPVAQEAKIEPPKKAASAPVVSAPPPPLKAETHASVVESPAKPPPQIAQANAEKSYAEAKPVESVSKEVVVNKSAKEVEQSRLDISV